LYNELDPENLIARLFAASAQLPASTMASNEASTSLQYSPNGVEHAVPAGIGVEPARKFSHKLNELMLVTVLFYLCAAKT
jgi:hypothetical protein